MKNCHNCGHQNEDAAGRCPRCGSVEFVFIKPVGPDMQRLAASFGEAASQLEFARKEGNFITFRCRTPDEAFLLAEELERADIIPIVPTEEELLRAYRRDGRVELRVSARAYESVADLRSVVEFQHKRVRAEQPLPNTGKLIAIGCGVILVPGLLLFVALLSSYRSHGCDRMARDFKLWFLLGMLSWVLLSVGVIASSQL